MNSENSSVLKYANIFQSNLYPLYICVCFITTVNFNNEK